MSHGTRSSMAKPSSFVEGDPASSSEEILDIAIECTFPASDPISVVNAYRSRERDEREVGIDPEADSVRPRPNG
jgi:hypothetical protein